ncbi:UNVERIFIED_CONTAM: hypothetical protein FKN15_016183 [Acipenser sinensis]
MEYSLDVSVFQHRLRTFTYWPRSDIIKGELLAQAGFYYAGQEDKETCFSCKNTLHRWEPGDDPWVEAQSYLSAAPVPMNVLVNNYAVRDLSGEGESLTRLVVSTLANDGKGAEPALSALNFMQMEEMADPKFKSDFADFFRDAKRMYRTYPYTFKDQNNNKYKMAFTKKSLECLLTFFSLLDLHSQRFFSFKDSDTTMELTVVLPGEYENTTFLADVQVRSFFSSDTAQNIENCIFECVRTRESGLSTTVVDTQLTVFDNIAIWRSEAGRYLQNYTPKLLLSMFTYRFTRPEESFLPSL